MAEYESFGAITTTSEVDTSPLDPLGAMALGKEISALMIRMAHGLWLDGLVVTLIWKGDNNPDVSFHFDGIDEPDTPLHALEDALRGDHAE